MYDHYQQNTYRSDLRKLVQSSSRYDFECIRELFSSFQQNHHDIRIFTLPKHFYDAQCVALAGGTVFSQATTWNHMSAKSTSVCLATRLRASLSKRTPSATIYLQTDIIKSSSTTNRSSATVVADVKNQTPKNENVSQSNPSWKASNWKSTASAVPKRIGKHIAK